MRVQGDMVLLKRTECRDRNCFKLSASKIWPDAKAGDHYTVSCQALEGGENALAIIRRCSADTLGSRKVNSQKRLSFPVPESLRVQVEKKKGYGRYHQTSLFGGD